MLRLKKCFGSGWHILTHGLSLGCLNKGWIQKNIHNICVVKKTMIHQQYFHWNVFCVWYFERLKGKWCNIEQLEKVIMHQYTFSGLTKDGQKLLCSLSKKKMTLLLEKVLWMYYNIITSLHNSNLFDGIRWIQNCLSKCKGLPRALATIFRTDLLAARHGVQKQRVLR